MLYHKKWYVFAGRKKVPEQGSAPAIIEWIEHSLYLINYLLGSRESGVRMRTLATRFEEIEESRYFFVLAKDLEYGDV